MEQAIQASPSVNTESKGSADLLNIIGTARGKGKGKDKQAAKGEEDLNALAPFLQLLNQQMSEKNKSSSALNINGKKITLEQAISLLQGDINLKELQQALAGLAQSGDLANVGQEQNGQLEILVDALLKKMDLMKKNVAAGNIKTDAKGKADITASLPENEFKAKTGNSENEQKAINDKTVILSSSGGTTLEKAGNKLSSRDGSSPTASVKTEGMEFKNAIAMQSVEKKSDNINFQSQIKDESSKVTQSKIDGMDFKKVISTKSGEEQTLHINPQTQSKEQTADNEIQFAGSQKEKLPLLKTDERTVQPEKVIFKEAQLSASTGSKIVVNVAAVKEENKISKDIQNSESSKEDHVIRNNSRLSLQETKESLISKDNLRFAQVQYQNTSNANAGNKAQLETMQAIMEEAAGQIKVEQKGKTISAEIRNEEIALNTANAVGSGSAKVEKSNSLSPGEIISQVTNEIKEMASNDGGRVKITLNPPSLGKLEMDVIVRNGKVEIVLVADNKDVQQTLNTHIDKLKGSLQTQGLTIERCDVFMQDKREEYQQSFSQQAFYQDGRSGQGNSSRQEIPEEKVKTPTSSIISARPVNISDQSTDSISLFA